MKPTRLDGWQALRCQPWLLALVVWLPPLLTLMFIALFASGTPKSLPVGVVDLDHSTESRAYLRHLDASPALALDHPYPSAYEGSVALQRGDILALVIVPPEFGRELRLSISPKSVAFYNSQYLLAGKFIASALTQANFSFSAQAGVALRLGRGYSLPDAIAAAAPLRPQVTALYNAGMSYALFLVASIMPALWQILIVVASVLALSWRLEQARLPAGFASRSRALWQLMAPISLILWLQGLIMLGMFSVFLGWRPQGSILWLVAGMALMVLAVQSMATLILSLVANKVRALSLCAAYLAPAFAFMGMTFPRGDMNMLARWWGNLMPSTHYMELQVAVADHGAPLQTLVLPLAALLVFLIPLALSIPALPQQMAIDPAEEVPS